MDRNDFRAVVAAIEKELKPGDIADICRRGNFSPMTFRKACKTESWEALTKGELNAIEATVKFLEERKDLMERAAALL